MNLLFDRAVARLHYGMPPDEDWPDNPPVSTRVASNSAASSRLACGASSTFAIGLGWFSRAQPQQFQTSFGEQRSVLLADGSRIQLNTASKIEVRLRAHQRSVRLLRGEALFDVAHDSARPFDVYVGNAVLRALGTQFNVDRRVDKTAVTVVEGRVAVIGENGKYLEERLPILAAGDRLVLDREGHGRVEHGVNVPAVTAWLQHQLVFDRRPLGEIAEEFNRYNLRHIEIRSPELRAKEATGIFESNDPASFITFTERIPGVHVTDDGRAGFIVTLEEIRAETK